MSASPPRRSRRIGAVAVVLLAASLPLLPVDRTHLVERAAEGALADAFGEAGPKETAWTLEIAEGSAVPHALVVRAAGDGGLTLAEGGAPLRVRVEDRRHEVVATVGENAEHARPLARWTAVLPPLVAIALALLTGRLLLSLGLAILLGSFLHFGPLWALPSGAGKYLWETVAMDPFKLWVIAFTVALIGMMAVCTRAGGTHGVVQVISRWVRGPRSAQVATGAMGLVIFFDDYANSVVVGASMRPLTDRLRISREKLAYLVDATAAPVAGLAIVSTWIGYEVGLLGAVSADLGLGKSGLELFLSALPFRFYCVFALVLVFLVASLGRDFGPMLAAERRARSTGKVMRDGARPLVSEGFTSVEPKPGIPLRWTNAVLPIATVLGVALVGLVQDGGGFAKLAERPGAFFSIAFWRDTLGSSENNVRVLAMASLAGSLVALSLAIGRRALRPAEALSSYWTGMRSMWMAITTLVLAWALAAVASDLGTADYLVALVRDSMPPALLPIATFLVAAAVAFATGTSWGTMSILIPTVVPLAFGLGDWPLAVIVMGAVLDGAIFGDHCSPLSDTTLLSSLATSCDHLDHVRTQLPYALAGMSVALLAGYIPATAGAPVIACYPIGIALLFLAVRLAGRSPEAAQQTDGSASVVPKAERS